MSNKRFEIKDKREIEETIDKLGLHIVSMYVGSNLLNSLQTNNQKRGDLQ